METLFPFHALYACLPRNTDTGNTGTAPIIINENGKDNMSEFLAHESCPQCGGSNTPPLARYDDGHAFCFSCGYYEGSNLFKKFEHFKKKFEGILPQPFYVSPMPTDVLPIFSKFNDEGVGLQAKEWLKKYEITPADVAKWRFSYSPTRECLVMPVYDMMGTLQFWQSRNFHPRAISKYTTCGRKEDYDLVIGDRTKETIVLVEDYISAIKVGKVATAMPLFGSDVSLARRSRLTRNFKNVVMWLDEDKWFDAMHWRRENRNWFENLTCVRSHVDPKGLSLQEIQKKLQGMS